jgi:uncharacterized repeat protein (TIGR04138 family)
MKESISFQVAVLIACQRDPRFAPGAYGFLCDTLGHTVKMLGREEAPDRHVSGPELLSGWRDLAVLEFGPLAPLVMREWGVQKSEDVGSMVFSFIEIGYFGKSETDRIEDFSDGVDLQESLERPFKVKGKVKRASRVD